MSLLPFLPLGSHYSKKSKIERNKHASTPISYSSSHKKIKRARHMPFSYLASKCIL
jgi:hypothetical protein